MKKTVIRFLDIIICAAVLCVSFRTGAFAKIPSPSRYFYVYDEANVLSLSTEDHIISVNDELYARCGAQIVVACVNTTGNTAIDDYAYKLFNKWEIGDKEQKNGVLVLLSIDDNNYYALQGKGLENLLSSGTLKVLLDQYLEPFFSTGDYDTGVKEIFDELAIFLSQIYSISINGVQEEQQDTTSVIKDESQPEWIQEILTEAVESFHPFSFLNSFFSIFSPFDVFDHISGFIKGISLSRIILIIAAIVIIRSLVRGRRKGGGGSTRG